MPDVRRQVLILRHGRSTWNAEHRWQGWLDAPLTEEGLEQAAARARELARDGVNPRVLYSSDLGRAARTAEIIAAHLEVPVITEPGFRERGGGDWQGHTSDEIETKWPELFAQWRRGELAAPPNGETDDVMLDRFDDALARALEHVGRGQLVVVTHGGLLRTVAMRAGARVDAPMPNLGGFWFALDGAGVLADPVALPALSVPTDVPDAE
jgi:probable phosphoglycerate mutase